MKNKTLIISLSILALYMAGCQSPKNGNNNMVKLITLDPAHFHAALVQKSMYPDVDSVVHVYAPSPDELGLKEQLNYINQYNSRTENPTHWVEKVYTGPNFLQKMLSEKKGNVVVLAGNNERKTEYIKKSIDDGLNVLADKPMAINTTNFDTLLHAFEDAKKNNVILYDIMTERSVMATVLQKKLMHNTALFGDLKQGTVDSPAVIMESVHRYYKQVSGKPLIRPDWFFDPDQQGDAIADVGTHLVDLVQWVCFPDQVIDYKKDIQLQTAKIWPTPITLAQFSNITKKEQFPPFLQKYLKDDSILLAHGNGAINYKIKNINVKVITKWTYDAPEGGGDTYYALLRGTNANLEIRQGQEESWKPVLYVWPKVNDTAQFNDELKSAIKEINNDYPGVAMERYEKGNEEGWKIDIPQKYMLGHEAHFADVVKRYLHYLKNGKLPDWETQGMITKYYITTKALEMAKQGGK